MHRFRARLPRRTIRVRLALLCVGVFLASGVAMLTVTVAVWQSTTRVRMVAHAINPPSPRHNATQGLSGPTPSAQHGTDRRQLLIASGVALALMRAQHSVLSAEDLVGQVWDENVDPFTNTVHVTISRLRRKLGEPRVIETIPNVGYRITKRS